MLKVFDGTFVIVFMKFGFATHPVNIRGFKCLLSLSSQYYAKEGPMIKKILWPLLAIIIVIILYFLLWPVAIDPVAWEAPLERPVPEGG